MPRLGGKNKMYSFKNCDLISNAAKLLALLQGIGESELIERILLDNLLPRHPFAKTLTTDCLLSDNGSVKYALSNLFHMAVGGVNVPDLQLYIDFVRKQELQSRSCLTGTEPELPHIIELAKSLSCELGNIWKQRGQERQNLDDIDLIDSLMHDLETAPACCILFNFYNVILKNWNDTKDLSVYIACLVISFKLPTTGLIHLKRKPICYSY